MIDKPVAARSAPVSLRELHKNGRSNCLVQSSPKQVRMNRVNVFIITSNFFFNVQHFRFGTEGWEMEMGEFKRSEGGGG